MRVALAQIDITPGQVQKNLLRARNFAEQAANLSADVVLFPEVFSTGLQKLSKEQIVESTEKTAQFLEESSKDLGIALCGSYTSAKSDAELPRNLFQFWSPKGLLAEYAKIHLITYLAEDERYQAGKEVCNFSYKGVRIRPAICYDLRFDYLFTDSASELDLYLVPACWPTERRRNWRALAEARAIDAQAYLVGVNRVGGGKTLQFSGGSVAFSPTGEVLLEGSACQAIYLVDIDPAKVVEWRSKFPALNERQAGKN